MRLTVTITLNPATISSWNQPYNMEMNGCSLFQ